MENLQHQSGNMERRVMSRIDAALRINYQIISDDVALNDPYDPNFVLPRYFLLLAELDHLILIQPKIKPYYRFLVRHNCTIHVTSTRRC